MKKMFLSSSFSDAGHFLKGFVGENIKGKRVTFIPTASAVEEEIHYVESAKVVFEELGMIVEVLDISNTDKSEAGKILKNNDFIYVSGGNTFFLLQELKRSEIDQLIIEQINSGKIYIGESAGSIIMAPDIDYVKYIDEKGKARQLESTKGLNLISIYPVPHYGHEFFNSMIDEVITNYNNKIPLTLISNSQVILVRDDDIEVI
ncbi:Type 1 glutamine amidotransferase-like domain-containing protein [Lysinibacillus agricola]|uniref:Type 1 glutamine amidotransferase-like domain-containing protein n=1 Tax=Lysinibacillus agricola TaxID=2590012 RepID=A0ABX7AYW6_9BACI|nr:MULTISPECIES: Type 1 glutamine amidotransferase-like domain-containing protein [Lysinibacillus]QQP14447.1 Type 1 glutamine amidotransferase-like domain-containing protein [Lysinibacillus agricola]